MGDCTMAFRNAPLPREDYVMLACRAAMAVADALAGRIKATPLENPPQLKGKSAGFEILTLDEILPEGGDTP